jgi:ribonuclease HI
MEIMAVIRGLGRIKNRSIPVIVHCDAKYVVKGVNEWRKTWEDRGWKNSRGKLVKNCDLWATLFTLVDQFERIKFVWVKAHNGNEWNEWADELAREGAEYAKEHV